MSVFRRWLGRRLVEEAISSISLSCSCLHSHLTPWNKSLHLCTALIYCQVLGKLWLEELLRKGHWTATIWQHFHHIQSTAASLPSAPPSLATIKWAAQQLMLATQSNWICTGPISSPAIVQVWERHQFSLCSLPRPPSETKHPSSSRLACLDELIAVEQPEFYTGPSKPLSRLMLVINPFLRKKEAHRGTIRQLQNDPASGRNLTSCRYLIVTFINQDLHRLDLNQAIWSV